MSMWRTRKALVGSVLALVAASVCVSLGFWQLRRSEQRETENAKVAQRSAATPQTPGDLAAVAAARGAEQVSFSRAVADGVYARDEEVLLTGRTSNGSPGHHVLTPLFTPDGRALLVDRGWVPLALDTPPVAQAPPPPGQVRVEGLVLPDQPKTRFSPSIPPSGDLPLVGRVDLPRLQQQVSRPLYPFWVQLEAQQPGQPAPLPLQAPPPQLTEGTHFSYALQWFAFAMIIIVGWPLLLQRSAQEARAARGEPREPGSPRPRTKFG